jgi:hypothetical protein
VGREERDRLAGHVSQQHRLQSEPLRVGSAAELLQIAGFQPENIQHFPIHGLPRPGQFQPCHQPPRTLLLQLRGATANDAAYPIPCNNASDEATDEDSHKDADESPIESTNKGSNPNAYSAPNHGAHESPKFDPDNVSNEGSIKHADDGAHNGADYVSYESTSKESNYDSNAAPIKQANSLPHFHPKEPNKAAHQTTNVCTGITVIRMFSDQGGASIRGGGLRSEFFQHYTCRAHVRVADRELVCQQRHRLFFGV